MNLFSEVDFLNFYPRGTRNIVIFRKSSKIYMFTIFTLSVGFSILGGPPLLGPQTKNWKYLFLFRFVLAWRPKSAHFPKVRKTVFFRSFWEHFYTTRHPCFHMCFLLFAYRPLRVNVLDFQGLHIHFWQTWRRRKSVFHNILSLKCIFHFWGLKTRSS